MGLGEQVSELVEAFGALVARHARLAQLELKEEARFVGLRLSIIAGLAPLFIVGYGFIMLALAILLRRVMPLELACLLVGIINIAIASVANFVARKQLREHEPMAATSEELQATTSLARRPGAKPHG